MSHLSLGGSQGKKTRGGPDSSDSESSENAINETPESLQDGPSSLESQPSLVVADIPAGPSEDKQEVQSEKEALALEARTPIHSGDTPGITVEGERNALKSAQDQAPNTAPADTPTPISKDSKSESKTVTSQAGSGKGNKATNLQDEKTEKKGSKKKKDLDTNKPPAMDQNANVEKNEKQTGQSKPKGKSQQEQKQNPMVFGPQTPSKVMQTKMYEKEMLLNKIRFLVQNVYSFFLFGSSCIFNMHV